MGTDLAECLVKSNRAYLIAPAGYGKTWTIADSVRRTTDGRQLILTHTHAGVHALRQKLADVPRQKYHVDTIAGWSLRYAASYPRLSGLGDSIAGGTAGWSPTGDDWEQVYAAADRLLKHAAIRDVIMASYAGLFVDEYQDCTVSQEQLVLSLASILPSRIIGDPLQGIYDFGGQQLADMRKLDSLGFERVPDLEVPWRWNKTGARDLGAWLTWVRERIESRQDIDLSTRPSGRVSLVRYDSAKYLSECGKLAKTNNERVLILHRQAQQCQRIAQCCGYPFQSMQDIYSDKLFEYCDNIGARSCVERALTLIDLAGECVVGIPDGLKRHFRAKPFKFPKLNDDTKSRDAMVSLLKVTCDDQLDNVIEALNEIKTAGRRMYNGELWYDVIRAIKLYQGGGADSLKKAAWLVRHRASQVGRPEHRLTVSRTVIVKGLEFDHAAVVQPEKLDKKNVLRKNLYVALTRGSRNLTIFYEQPVIRGEATQQQCRLAI